MKTKQIVIAMVLSLIAKAVSAQMPYMEEVKALGAIAGQGLACGASKYDDFELLARAILLTKSPSDKLQTDAIYAYSEEKADVYMSKELDALIIKKFLRRCSMGTAQSKCPMAKFLLHANPMMQGLFIKTTMIEKLLRQYTMVKRQLLPK